MKNGKFSKILVLALSLALLIGSAVEIAVSADTTDSTGEIYAQTIVHKDKIQIAFAVDATAEEVLAGTVALEYYFDGATENTKTAALYVDANGDAVLKDGNVILVTEGVSAQDLTSVVTATTKVNGEAKETKTYSVVQFLLTKLYKDGFATLSTNSTSVAQEYTNKKYTNLYKSLIDYSAKAQAVFDPGETSIEQYFTVQISDGRDDPFTVHSESFTLTLPTTVSIPNSTFMDKWYVTEYNTGTYTEYDAGAEVVISTHTVITPVVEVDYGTGKYFNDTTVDGLRLDFSKDSHLSDYFMTSNNTQTGNTYAPYTSATIQDGILTDTGSSWNGFVIESDNANKYASGKYVFEADFSVTSSNYKDTGVLFFSFMPDILDEAMLNVKDSKGNVMYKNTTNNPAFTSGYLTVTGNASAVGDEYVIFDKNAPMQFGVVYNVRFEYDIATKLITTYINGVKTGVYQGNASGANRIVNDDSEFFGIGIYYRKASTAINFDNIYIGVVDGVVAE